MTFAFSVPMRWGHMAQYITAGKTLPPVLKRKSIAWLLHSGDDIHQDQAMPSSESSNSTLAVLTEPVEAAENAVVDILKRAQTGG